MPKEVRAILFTPHEVRLVMEHFMQKGAGLQKLPPIEKVELQVVKGALRGSVHLGRGADAKVEKVAPQELMSAVLMYCNYMRIPLATRALKQLEATASSGLMLTMAMNQDPAPPKVTGNSIDYSAPLPTAMTEVVASVRE